ncbi:hypothetical protein [Nocardia sp. R6R-6]|uniref:hypothetical protein n=1 Tax=Nocardia sp. R6R-6 TaxID=3459303 RepID=UPI00403DF005
MSGLPNFGNCFVDMTAPSPDIADNDIAGLNVRFEAWNDEEIPVKSRKTGYATAIVSFAALCTSIGCASAEPAHAASISLVVPDSLGGREKIVRPPNAVDQADQAAEIARFRAAVPTADTIIDGLYRKGTSPSGLILMAGTARIEGDLETTLDRLIYSTPTDKLGGVGGVLTPDLKFVDLVSVAPGPLGGLAKCAGQNRRNDPYNRNYPVAVCVWADRGSVGSVIWPTASVEVAGGEFAAIRGQVEQVS